MSALLSRLSAFGLWTLLVLAGVGLIVTLLSDRAIRRTLARRPGGVGQPDDDPAALARMRAPITVLKPVKGLDEGLYENLVSLFEQDHPDFEIWFGAELASDPALLLARELAAAYPHVRARTVVCPDDGGLNPKVSILRALTRRVRTDLVLISDSNVRVGRDYLRLTARELGDPGVGLVTNPIAGTGELSPGAVFEGLHLTTYVARALAFAAAYLGRACVVGKSMLFRRSDLEKLGGFASVRDVLAEDYALGHAFERAGFRVVVSPVVIGNYNRRWPIGRFVNRHMRWGQMRRRTCLAAYLLEPLLNPTALFVLAGLWGLLVEPAEPGFFALVILGLGLKLSADWSLLGLMRRESPGLGFVLLGVPKDLLVLAMWALAGFRRTIDWRGRRFFIGAGTRLERIEEPALLGATSRT